MLRECCYVEIWYNFVGTFKVSYKPVTILVGLTELSVISLVRNMNRDGG